MSTRAAYLLGIDAVGAGIGPSVADLKPYFLTELPPDGGALAMVYAAYLRALDNLISSVTSVWHPATSNATFYALHGARQAIVEAWWSGTPEGRIGAVQQLAGLIGWFNANYMRPDGAVDWKALDQPVNAGIINGSRAAAQAVADVTDAAAGAAKTAWWTFVIGGAAVVGVAALLIWKAMDSGTARAAVERMAPFPFRRN